MVIVVFVVVVGLFAALGEAAGEVYGEARVGFCACGDGSWAADVF